MSRPSARLAWLAALALVAAVALGAERASGAAHNEPRRGVVPLWGRFEMQVLNAKAYANPFRDVTLVAAFTSPGGRKVNFLGYHDGDGKGGQVGTVWKLRFMPDEVGEWSYRCQFSDGTPGASGTFACVADGARPGPLRIKGPWLRLANGARFHPRSYYFSEAFTAPSPHWEKAVDRFFGGACRYDLCCTTFWQGRLLARKKWNALPYNGFCPIAGKDYTRLNVAAWRHVDDVLQRLEARGAVWFNFDGFVPNVGGEMGPQRADPDAQKAYARNVVARLAPCWNVVWNIAFEWWEFMSADQVKELAEYIRGLDPWKHPLTVHDQGRLGSGEEVVSKLGVDFVTLQHDAGRCGDAVAANRLVLRYAGKWPVYAAEVCWEGPHKLDGDGIRKGAWGVALAGGILNYAEQFDQVYGNGKGFPYVEILFDLLDSLPWHEMKPHNDLVGKGQLCLARPGEVYLCYAPAGGKLELDLSGAAGRFDAQWFDPRKGARSPAPAVAGGARRAFQCPDSSDWALLVNRRKE